MGRKREVLTPSVSKNGPIKQQVCADQTMFSCRLTYKYSRLIQQSDDGRPGELPQAERCVVDDDEEDEEEVKTRETGEWGGGGVG